jgi:succinate dehydrogenase / fumarate reductase flavoprotein subunit
MEFISFVPEVDSFAEAPTDLAFILLGLGSELRNGSGERFMARYDPERKERSSAARLARAIFEESRDGPVVSSLTEETIESLREIPPFQPFLKEGEIRWRVGFGGMLGGAAHRVFQTRVEGLFVAGEMATGLHGADQLPSVGTSFTLYASENAGSQAASYSTRAKGTGISESEIHGEEKKLDDLLSASKKIGEKEIRKLEDRLRAAMWRGAGVLRDEPGLKEALREIEEIGTELSQKGAENMEGVARLLQLKNLTTTGKVVCQAALARRESRGQHQRVDHPSADISARRIGVFLGSSGIEIRESPISP